MSGDELRNMMIDIERQYKGNDGLVTEDDWNLGLCSAAFDEVHAVMTGTSCKWCTLTPAEILADVDAVLQMTYDELTAMLPDMRIPWRTYDMLMNYPLYHKMQTHRCKSHRCRPTKFTRRVS